MAGFLLAAIKTLAIPVDEASTPRAMEASVAVISARASPRTSIPTATAPAASNTRGFVAFDLAQQLSSDLQLSTEEVAAKVTPSFGHPLPAVAVTEPNENPTLWTDAMSAAAATPVQHATNNPMGLSTADGAPRTTVATAPPAPPEDSSPRSPSPEFGMDDFLFVPFVDAMENDDWLLIPDEFNASTEADATASSAAFLDSFNNNLEDHVAPYGRADSDTVPDEKSEPFLSFELHEEADINFREIHFGRDDSSLSSARIASPPISLPSSESDDVEFPETSEISSVDDTNSDSSGISFRELFNDPMSEELDWEDDHFHDCGDEFLSEMNGSCSPERDSKPLLPLEEDSSCGEECLMLLFYEEEDNLDNEDKILDVVEELQPTDFNAVPSGYPVNDLPILEGNFFHLADTPPYEEATETRNVQTDSGSMFLFEIPGKYNEEVVVQNMGADVIASFISGPELRKCGIVFGDFDSSLPPSPPGTEDGSDAVYPHVPYSSRVTPSPSPQKSMSLSSLPSSETMLSSSCDSSCLTCSSPTLSSEFFACTDSLPAENEADQLDSLEEKCFKLYDENDVEASFDCFPMRLQSARKVDYRGCGTRKTRRMRKRW